MVRNGHHNEREVITAAGPVPVRAPRVSESARTRWRAVNAPHLVALVRPGAIFKNGKLIERPDGSEGGDQQVA